MAKSISNRGKRRALEREIQKGKTSGKVDSEMLLYNIKYKLTPQQANQLIKTLPEDLTKLIKLASLPKTYSDLRKNKSIFFEDNFLKELNWVANDLLLHLPEINLFIELEKSFENFFVLGDYKEAKNVIETIESSICVSHYTIEKRLLLAEYEVGFKANKENLTTILESRNNPVVDILAKHQSIRVERNLSYFRYQDLLDGYLNNYSDNQFKEYFRFKLNYFATNKSFNTGFLLHIDDSSSIIDKYLSFLILISESLSSKNISQDEIDFISEILTRLSDIIDDRRITNFSIFLGILEDISLTGDEVKFLEILDNYTLGDYTDAKAKAKDFLKNNPINLDIYDVYIKSTISLNEPLENIFPQDSLAFITLNDLYNITSKNNETQNSLIGLHKTFNSVGLNPWTYKCHAFFCKEHSFNDPSFSVHTCSELFSYYINPRLAIYIKNKIYAEKYIRLLEKKVTSNAVLFWKRIIHNLLKKDTTGIQVQVEEFREKLYEAWNYQLLGLDQIALDKLIELRSNPALKSQLDISFNNEDVNYQILLCYANLRDYKNALELITEINIKNPNMLNKFRYSDLITKISLFEDEKLFGEISAPILLHQYIYDSTLTNLWVAYDNFLSFYGLNFPKELEQIKEKFPREKLIYFLKNLCKQEIYYNSYQFQNQDDLDNERIEICVLLTQLDSENSKDYLAEISEISRNQLIRKGIKQIDESKIYVDIKGIYNALKKDLTESFERSQNLLNLSLDQIQKLDATKDNVIVPYYGKSSDSNKVEAKKENLKVTSYSRLQEFIDMFSKIRDKFIASNEFGIDTYLSMRIRHGTLLSEIRSVFEKHSLITKKDETSNSYLENEYWNKKDFYSNNEIRSKMNELLGSFSSQIDLISEELKNNRIQIRTDIKNTEGLFDYSFDSKELHRYFKLRIGAIENFEEFFDTIVAILWERTEINLSIIREHISENIKNKFIGLLGDLNNSIEILVNKSYYPDVNELIRNITTCQTDVTYEIQKIASWFNRSHSKTINDFFLHLPIDASLATLKRFKDFSNFNPTIENNCDLRFDGEYFPAFADLMQNLFHNIVLHSKLPQNETEAKISIDLKETSLSITVQNKVSNHLSLEGINKKIEETAVLLRETHDSEKTRSEKGSGYLKILKTLKTDLSRENYKIIILPVTEERIFKTSIEFSIINLLKKE